MIVKRIPITSVDELYDNLCDKLPSIFNLYNYDSDDPSYANINIGHDNCILTPIVGTSKYRIDITTDYDEYLMYFYAEPYSYVDNGITKNAILITPYYANDTAINDMFIRDNANNYGPNVVYNKNNTLYSRYSRSGFINYNANTFLLDSLSICYSDDNKPQNFLTFDFNNKPTFIISITDNNNFGTIGVTVKNATTYNVSIISHNNNTTQEHNLYKIQIKNSSITSMTKLFLPESTNGEYFNYIYLVTASEPNNINLDNYIYNQHIYLPCLDNYLTLLTY